jgi:hypothetical protein
MQRVGLGRFAKSSCPSPFRPDQCASWGIFELNGRWLFKDFGTGECGDELAFLSQLHGLDCKRDFFKLLDLYRELAAGTGCEDEMKAPVQSHSHELPDQSFLNLGTSEQLENLSKLRNIRIAGLQSASDSGILKFGTWRNYDVYAVSDRSGLVVELRRLDGEWFEGSGSSHAYKSHTVKHSRKNWPIGILEAEDCAGITLVEGMPDLLAMHQIVVEENLVGKVGPVAMLTSACDIAAEALPHFAGKSVRIFPHLDQAGLDAAERWQTQLIEAGVRHVVFFNFRACEIGANKIKDLCDFNQQRGCAGNPINILESLAL